MTIIPRATVGLNGPISWKQRTVHLGLLVLRQRQGQLHAPSVYAGRVGDFRHGMLRENSAVLPPAGLRRAKCRFQVVLVASIGDGDPHVRR
jgi:hypothetical protein